MRSPSPSGTYGCTTLCPQHGERANTSAVDLSRTGLAYPLSPRHARRARRRLADLYTVDAVHEFPLLFPGMPARLVGREEIRETYRAAWAAASQIVTLEEIRNVVSTRPPTRM